MFKRFTSKFRSLSRWKQVIFILLAVSLLCLPFFFLQSGKETKTQEALLYQKPVDGTIASSNILSGKIVASSEQYVYFDGSKGDLEAVYVNVGDQVEEGTTLVQYRSTDAQVAYDTAIRALNKAQRAINDFQNSGANTASAPAAVGSTNSGEASDGGESSSATASPSSSSSYASQLADLQDAYADALDNVNKTEDALNQTTVTSTISGTVVEVNRDVSKSATGSSQTVVHIVSNGGLQVKGELSEYQLAQIKVDQEVFISSKVYPDQSWTGKINYISNYPKEEAASSSTSTGAAGGPKYPFTVELTSEAGDLRQGFTVSMEVNNQGKGLVLPLDAVITEGDKTYVWVYSKGRVKKTEVVLGTADAINQEIKSGVTKEDQVLVNPHADLKDGQEVSASEVPHSDK